MNARQISYLNYLKAKIVPSHILPNNTIFRFKERWWRKTGFNEGIALASENVKVEISPTNFVLVRNQDLPNTVYTMIQK